MFRQNFYEDAILQSNPAENLCIPLSWRRSERIVMGTPPIFPQHRAEGIYRNILVPELGAAYYSRTGANKLTDTRQVRSQTLNPSADVR